MAPGAKLRNLDDLDTVLSLVFSIREGLHRVIADVPLDAWENRRLILDAKEKAAVACRLLRAGHGDDA